jgi:DNA repair protein SbcD/Mre11
LKILFTGDVHIGRRSSRLPPHVDGRRHSCGAAWHRIVEQAIVAGVDLVAVGGDLVDQANRYMEAIGPLERGLRRLSDAGIHTAVVCGNHDHDVLPALVDAIGSESIRLLGRGGRWERLTMERQGARVHLDGWSFPHGQYRSNPLQFYGPRQDGTPVLALLHCDLEQPGSRYAPVGLADLRRHPEVFFLLGHVHVPRLVEEAGGARYLYAGSPQAMDPGETGARGVWLVEVEPGGVLAESVPLSSVRYEVLDVSVEGLERADEIEGRVFSSVRSSLDALVEGADAIRLVRYRLRLTGATRLQREIETRLNEVAADLELSAGEAMGSIESFAFETRTAHDLVALAAGVGPPAVLARLLRDAESNEGLRSAVRGVVGEVQGSRSFVEINGGPDELKQLEELGMAELRRAATILLDELLLQKSS